MLVCFLGQVQRASALTIIRDFLGGSPGTNSTGSGNLTNIFNTACDVWELAIRDTFTLTLHYCWTNSGGGEHTLNAQGGTPNRETEGTIYFNNDDDTNHDLVWLDTSPLLIRNWTNTFVQDGSIVTTQVVGFVEELNDLVYLVGGPINSARWCKVPSGVNGDAFSTALHEIGHALGLSYGNSTFTAESVNTNITITSGPYAGMVVPLKYNDDGVVSHIGQVCDTGLTLMSGGGPAGTRILPSVLDMAVLGQLSQFTNLNWNLTPIPKINGPYTQVIKDGGHKNTTNTVVTVSWIQPMGGQYLVEQCSDLRAGNWSTNSTTIAVTNGYYSVSIPVASGNEFFRLKQVQ